MERWPPGRWGGCREASHSRPRPYPRRGGTHLRAEEDAMTRKTNILMALAVAALWGAPAAARADEKSKTERTPHGMSQQRERHVTATITAIDKANRTVTLAEEGGEKQTVEVPENIKGFDKLK